MKIVSKSGLGLEHYNVNIESNQWDVFAHLSELKK